ncbi:MAG: DUF4097 family beta strand repeat-containing protein [Clostridiales bacterium]|jgi:DUF4097 and DUF4098 domain-containing protein YvlB|nr:DUF4097 family beta strand repeat-containing protein [Clostridiales bacterium]
MSNDNGKREDYIDLREDDYKEPAFEESSATEPLKPRRLKRRWGKLGALLITAGLIFMAAGWVLGARGGSIWFDRNRGRFSFSTGEEAARNDINITQRNMETFTSAEISSSVADVEFIPSNDYGLEIRVPEGTKPEWKIENGTLKVEINSNNKINLFGFYISTADYFVKVYYPKNKLGNVEIDVLSGDVFFPEAEVGRLAVKVAAGDVKAGAIRYSIAQIEANAGDIEFDGFGEPGETEISVSAGTITASVKDGKKVNLKTDAGDIIADLEGCESVEVKTSSGEITLNGIDTNNTSMELKTNLGSIRIDGENADDEYILKNGGKYTLNAKASSGDIIINE